MKKLTVEEIGKAHFFWYKDYESAATDKEIAPYLEERIKAFQPQQAGWLKKARQALFLSTQSVADQLRVSRAAYSRYEQNEDNGSITLATLAKAAEAMDCELVYAIRPKNKKTYSHSIWNKLLAAAKVHPWLRTCDQNRRALALAALAKKFMTDADFRKKQAWSQRANTKTK